MYRLALHIFPILQVGCFVAALFLFETNLVVALILLFCAALFLNFSLHITIHHWVHFGVKNKAVKWVMETFYSILMGLAFSFYRMQHFNHHRYDNRIGDFTSTWVKKGNSIAARPFFKYSFVWFLGPKMNTIFERAIKDGDLKNSERIKMRIQLLFVLAFYLFLFVLNPWFSAAYFLMFYVGWSLIAITNYGQHLPIKYDSTEAYTYSNSLYNWLFFNNGLHLEHHRNPHLNYPELKAKQHSEIAWPHLLIAFFRKK
ncbi:MAG: fatty acid desaturase family protein [Salibacteraceae bacterium]